MHKKNEPEAETGYLLYWFILGPLRTRLGFGFFPIENIVHYIENPPGNLISTDKLDEDFVREGLCMAPWADPDTDAAVGTNLPPISCAGFRIQLPF